jgi:fructose-1,6-bisphosphatase/inositol monophosphatase family enzyme
VSIGLAVDKKVVMGVIYDPYQDELFLAAKVGQSSGLPPILVLPLWPKIDNSLALLFVLM